MKEILGNSKLQSINFAQFKMNFFFAKQNELILFEAIGGPCVKHKARALFLAIQISEIQFGSNIVVFF
jgi:hypothetical protein